MFSTARPIAASRGCHASIAGPAEDFLCAKTEALISKPSQRQRGSLSVPGHRLTVGELAYIDADTVAREVVVYGALKGGLCAFERIEIKKHASVAGDVATAKIVIEDGANFKGVISADASAARAKP